MSDESDSAGDVAAASSCFLPNDIASVFDGAGDKGTVLHTVRDVLSHCCHLLMVLSNQSPTGRHPDKMVKVIEFMESDVGGFADSVADCGKNVPLKSQKYLSHSLVAFLRAYEPIMNAYFGCNPVWLKLNHDLTYVSQRLATSASAVEEIKEEAVDDPEQTTSTSTKVELHVRRSTKKQLLAANLVKPDYNCVKQIVILDVGCFDDGDTRCAMCLESFPSGGLKQCGTCASARYCDRDCQRAHWRAHKQKCKKNR